MRDTHLIFNGSDLADLLYVTGIERSMVPKRDIERAAVAGTNGELLRSAALGAMEVTVTARIRRIPERGVTEARRALAGALYTEREARLILPDEPDKYYLAIYEGGAEPSRLEAWPEVKLAFCCPDPVAFGAPRAQQVTGTASVNAGGTWPARPMVTCRPPAGSSWSILNVSTGEQVVVSANFTGGQTVVLDMDMERCTINGADHAVSMGSDFFAINGTQRVRVSSGTATLEWRERWL